MPQLIAMIPALVAAAGGVAGVAGSAMKLFGGHGSPGPADNSAALAAQNDEANKKAAAGLEAQKAAMLRRAAPNAQATTGGSLAPDSFANLSAILAGLPGDGQLAQRVLGGNNDIGGFGSGFGSTNSFGSGNSGLIPGQGASPDPSGAGMEFGGLPGTGSGSGSSGGGSFSGNGGSMFGGDFSDDGSGTNMGMQEMLSQLMHA